MCDPISLGLLAAGTAMQVVGNNQAKRASWDAYNAEQTRQKAKTAEQDNLLDQSYSTADKLKDPNAQNDAAAKRTAAFVSALNARPATTAYLPGQDAAPKVIADTAANAAAGQSAYSNQQAGALANMTGANDQLLNTNLALNRNSQTIGQLGQDKYHSAQVLDSELNAAKYKGGTLRGLGGLGQLLGMAALNPFAGMGAGVGTKVVMSPAAATNYGLGASAGLHG